MLAKAAGVTLAFLIPLGCGSSSSKVVDYGWSSVGAIRTAANDAVQQECTKQRPNSASWDTYVDVSCVATEAAKRFDASLPALRLAALRQTCSDTKADKVRMTWQTYQGDSITQTFDCHKT